MQIKMLTCLSAGEWVLNAGDTGEFPDEEARSLIEAGIAEAALEAPAVDPAGQGQTKRATRKAANA